MSETNGTLSSQIFGITNLFRTGAKDDAEGTIHRLLKQLDGKRVNLLLVGATGSGKSSTCNSLFNMGVAKIGMGADPQTKDITSYELENLTIWDTPGFGDSESADAEYARQIAAKLDEADGEGHPAIDVVLMILDAASKDMGASSRLISETVLPHLHIEQGQHMLVAINQADMAMKGNHWNAEKNCPDETLKAFLDGKVDSVARRIREATGVTVEPIYYCAGYTDDDGTQRKAYNLAKLLYRILALVDSEKLLAFAGTINDDEEMFVANDEDEDYGERIAETLGSIIHDCMDEGASKGAQALGMVAGIPGIVVGLVVGGLLGGVAGLFKGLLKV